MTALSVFTMACRVAAATLGGEVLGQFLGRIYRCVAEVAAAQRGELLPVERDDLLVVWRTEAPAGSPEAGACRAAWEIQERIGEIQPLLGLKYAIQLRARIGIATDLKGAVPRARLLQRANLFYGTMVLTDQTTAQAAETMELREIDLLSATGDGLLWRPEAVEATRIPYHAIAAFGDPPTAVHELLGPRGEVHPGVLGFREAFQTAIRLCRSRDWQRAQTILEKLSAARHGDRLVALYLDSCREGASSAQSQTLPDDVDLTGVA